jgi:hypothetical protein
MQQFSHVMLVQAAAPDGRHMNPARLLVCVKAANQQLDQHGLPDMSCMLTMRLLPMPNTQLRFPL